MALDLYSLIYLLGLVPLAVGLWQLKRCLDQRSWIETEGRIMHSEVQLGRPGSKEGASPIIRYEYQVGSQRYDSSKFSVDNFSGGVGHCRALVRRYPLGQNVKVFYNPDNPEQAVLERRITMGTYFWLAIGVFFTCTLYLAMHSN
jgi:hypothetical protein